MSFLRRLLSAEYRKAVAAEAAGDYVEAARRYALAGERRKVAEMHLARAERATTREEEIASLRDAEKWADEATDVRRRVARGLAGAILQRARAEGMATERDREAVREAARLYEAAGDLGDAGATWEQLGDDEAAARAYEKGGLVEKMELALARGEKRARGARRLKEAFEEYELHWKSGDREAAAAALRVCCDVAEGEDRGEYRRLLDRLESRRIASGRVALRRLPKGQVTVACGAGRVGIGRDTLCELTLRAGGISRVHAEIIAAGGEFRLRDGGSRNGTWLGGMPVAGEVALAGTGAFALGEDCELSFAVQGAQLLLEVARGLDRGVKLLAAAPEADMDVEAASGLAGAVRFREGRPYLTAKADRVLLLNGARIARGAVQLVREDLVAIGDVEVEVL